MIQGIRTLFGGAAFRIPDENAKPGNSINAALFDAQAVGLSLANLTGCQLARIAESDFLR